LEEGRIAAAPVAADVLTGESVATEIARSAVGGIALALAVPLTTAVAAVPEGHG
jgi:uncharacterized membrane protein